MSLHSAKIITGLIITIVITATSIVNAEPIYPLKNNQQHKQTQSIFPCT